MEPEKIILSSFVLRQIKDAAGHDYKNNHYEHLEADVQIAYCYIKAFLQYAKRQGWDVPEAATLDRGLRPKS